MSEEHTSRNGNMKGHNCEIKVIIVLKHHMYDVKSHKLT